jgi:hypothetical protein
MASWCEPATAATLAVGGWIDDSESDSDTFEDAEVGRNRVDHKVTCVTHVP